MPSFLNMSAGGPQWTSSSVLRHPLEAINGDRTSVLGMPIDSVKTLLGALDYNF